MSVANDFFGSIINFSITVLEMIITMKSYNVGLDGGKSPPLHKGSFRNPKDGQRNHVHK